MRTILRALALVLVAIVLAHAPAVAQQPTPQTVVQQVQLGVRAAGGTYPLALNAANANCEDPLDFRFTSNAPWLKLPADPVVRGVAMGETRTLQATIDLTNMSPGRYQATVEVECENCGWFVFKSCKIDKQQIQFFLDVAPAAAPQPQPPGQGDPALRSDSRVPKALRDALAAADKAVDEAKKRKQECDEKLKQLQAEAVAAKAAADKAAAEAKALADKAAAAEEAAKKAKAELDRAKKEKEAADAHVQRLKDETPPANRDLPKTPEMEAAEATAKAAQEAVDAAALKYANAELAAKAAREAAGQAAKNAQKPADAAKAAADAVAAKEKHHNATEDKLKEAEAARAAAEEAARKAIPPPPPGARTLTPEELHAQAKAEFDRCNTERLERLVRQAKALKFLIEVGAIKGEQAESLAKDLKKAIDDANKYIKWMPTPVGQAVSKALDLAGQGLDIALKLQNLNAKVNLTPNAADSTKDAIKAKLKDDGQAKDDAEAEKIYKEMKTITDNGLDKAREFWDREREAADKSCNAAKEKLDAAAKAAGK